MSEREERPLLFLDVDFTDRQAPRDALNLGRRVAVVSGTGLLPSRMSGRRQAP